MEKVYWFSPLMMWSNWHNQQDRLGQCYWFYVVLQVSLTVWTGNNMVIFFWNTPHSSPMRVRCEMFSELKNRPYFYLYFSFHPLIQFGGLMQERRNSSVLAMELSLSSTNPLSHKLHSYKHDCMNLNFCNLFTFDIQSGCSITWYCKPHCSDSTRT